MFNYELHLRGRAEPLDIEAHEHCFSTDSIRPNVLQFKVHGPEDPVIAEFMLDAVAGWTRTEV